MEDFKMSRRAFNAVVAGTFAAFAGANPRYALALESTPIVSGTVVDESQVGVNSGEARLPSMSLTAMIDMAGKYSLGQLPTPVEDTTWGHLKHMFVGSSNSGDRLNPKGREQHVEDLGELVITVPGRYGLQTQVDLNGVNQVVNYLAFDNSIVPFDVFSGVHALGIYGENPVRWANLSGLVTGDVVVPFKYVTEGFSVTENADLDAQVAYMNSRAGAVIFERVASYDPLHDGPGGTIYNQSGGDSVSITADPSGVGIFFEVFMDGISPGTTYKELFGRVAVAMRGNSPNPLSALASSGNVEIIDQDVDIFYQTIRGQNQLAADTTSTQLHSWNDLRAPDQ